MNAPLTRVFSAYKATNCSAYLFILPCSLFMMYLLGLAFETLQIPGTSAGGVIDYMQRNLNAPPISELLTIVGKCPTNYEQITLGHWPGTISEQDGEISLYPIPLYNWKNQTFCARHNKDYEFTLHNCKEGYRKCQEFLCVSTDELCPITGIHYEKEINKNENITLTNNEIIIGNRLYTLERNSADEPLIFIEISFYGIPCFAIDRIPEKPSPPNKYLRANLGCGKFGFDPSTRLVDSISELKLYEDNSLKSKLETIPGYMESIEGEIVYLAFRLRIELRDLDLCYEEDPKFKHSAAQLQQSVLSHGKLTLILNS